MKDKTGPQLNEHLIFEGSASLKACLSEVRKKKMAFTDPVYIVDFLTNFWKLEPTKRHGVKINLLPVLTVKTKTSYSAEKAEPRVKWYAGLTGQFIKDVQDIDRKLQGRILQAITHIIKDPVDQKGDTIKPLSSDFKGLWRYRIGPFRLVYLPDQEKYQITFISFESRGEVYKT